MTVESYGHAVMLNLKGELTEDSIGALDQAVAHQLEDAGVVDVVLNFEAVPFVDSAALEYMLDLRDRLAERFGQVKIVRPDENILTILEITRLRSAFEVFQDPAEAVKAVQA
ncbi:MAG: STAS domain-containing protein [Planctomycetes bacterium]|nr:STAS domain-containing protein [Planctomycetota bacterium]